MKYFVKSFELFYFVIYDWFKNNASNWYAGPLLMSSGLIFLCISGNVLLIIKLMKQFNSFYIIPINIIILSLYFYLSFHYNEKHFERIEENFIKLTKTQRKTIRLIAFIYVISSIYMFFYSVT